MMGMTRQEVLDECNRLLKLDPELITRAFQAFILVDKPSLLQSDPITVMRGNKTVMDLMGLINTLHESGERIRPIIKNGLITSFF